jgi:hypothetical protein
MDGKEGVDPFGFPRSGPVVAASRDVAFRRVFHDSATLCDPASLSIRRPFILVGRLPTLDPESLAGLAALD